MNQPRKSPLRSVFLAGSVAAIYGAMTLAGAETPPIKADPNAGGANRPVVDNTANGRPLVQIVAPNGAGVSHNQYQQFNVERGGAILNNATGNALTQQGGWVGANPNLGGNAARLIVNEVTSTNPSQLRGYLEVAGRRADVVVSNPNGIMVDGFGFINASRGTLTTGTPVFGAGGSLDALRVTQGNIAVGGNGLNDQGTAQVDLMARSVQVNAALWADRLNLVTGANQVNYADLGVQLVTGAGGVPTVAVDVAAVGGMYANRIRLIGTEHGVGVKSYGKMASAGDFQIDSAGKITLNADASAGGVMRLSSSDAIVNQARISSGGAMELNAASLDNQGKEILSGGNLAIAAGSLNNTAGSIRSNRNAQLGVQSGFAHARGNTVAAAGDLAIVTAGDFANQTEMAAGGKLSVQAANISNNKDGLLSAGQTTLLQAVQNVSNTGRIYGQDVAISAQSLINDHEGVYGDSVPAGVIAARNSLNVGAATVLNREHALMKSDGDLSIGGALDAGNKATGQATSVTNSSATIDAGGKLSIASAALLNSNAHFASESRLDPGKTRSWTEYEIDGSPQIYSPDEIRLSAEGGLMKLVVKANDKRHNNYTIRNITETTRGTVVTQTDPGRILARGDMLLNGGTVTNDKSAIVAGGALTGNITGVDNGGSNPQGELYVRRDIVSTHRTTKRCGPLGTRRCNQDSISHPSVDLPVTHFDLGIWKTQAHTLPAGAANPATGRAPYIALLPASQLYRPSTAPGATWFIETDSAFLNYRLFLSSDYQLGRMAMNPATTQKRLGDGYYEQQQVNEQILRLTGRKALGAYASNEDQYKALMDAGVTYAQNFGIVPGVALTAAQMAQLTSDMVWLVEQTVALPDGSTQTALVPKVYLSRLRAGDVKPAGALIAADNINLQINGSLANAGTLQANTGLIVNATQDIVNTLGAIASDATGGTTTLTAGRDLSNQSGTIGGNRVGILAGRDVAIATLVNTTNGVNGTQVALDRTGSINAGTLTLQAQRDVNLNAAAINTSGDATITAGNNLNLNAVKTQDELNVAYDQKNHLYKKQEQANGTAIQTEGNTTLTAGKDINTQAAYVNSAKAITATAGGSINIGVATQDGSYEQATYSQGSGLLSSTATTTLDQRQTRQSVGSTFSGNTLSAQAAGDVNLTGSAVVATGNVSVTAGNDVNIVASQDTGRRELRRTETRSGLMAGGNSISVGQQVKGLEQSERSVTHNLATVGSHLGSISVQAGRDAQLAGAQLQADKDISVAGRNVSVAAVVDTLDTRSLSYTQTSGLRVGGKSNITDAAMALRAASNRGQEVNDPRLKALYAAKAAYAARDLAQIIQTAQQSQSGAGGLSGRVSIGIGATREERLSIAHVDTVQKTQAAAGGNLNITARGDATPEQGDIRLKGSALKGETVTLDARRDLIAQSQQAASKTEDSYKRLDLEAGLYAGGSVGGNGGAKGGMGVYGAIDYRQNKTELTNLTHVETTVDAAKKLTISTGRDATLTGAVATADQIKASIGRDLTLTSEQDTDRYRQQQIGGQLEGRYAFGNDSGVSGSLSYSKTSSDYKSVQEQTALNAGKGGFDITVGNHTQLNGAKIDSAAGADKNKLSTNTLGYTNLKNEAGYNALSLSVNFGGGGSSGTSGTGPALPTTALPGVGVPTSDHKESTTKSAIAAGNIEVRQDQAAGANSTAGLSRDTAGANQKLDRIFDANKVAEQQEMSRVLGEVGNRAIGDLSQQLGLTDGSPEKMALHAMLAALQVKAAGGNALAAATATGSLEWVGTQVAQYLSEQAGLKPTGDQAEDNKRELQRKAIQQWAALLTGAAIGGAVGGNGNAALAGGAASLDAERFNRQLHPKEITWLERNKERASKALSEKLERPVSEQEALRYLTMAGEGNTDQAYHTQYANNLGLQTSEERQLYNAAKQYIAQYARESFVDDRGLQQSLFVAKGNDFKDGSVYGQYRNDQAYRDFYWNTMGDNLKPDNPTAQEMAVYQQREKIRLENSAKQLATGAIPAVMGWTAGTIVKNGVKTGASKPETEKVFT